LVFRNFAGLLAVVLALGSNSVWAHAQEGSLHKIEIVRLAPRFDKLVPLGVRIDKIAGGHKWVEGPVWNRKEGYLLFIDVIAPGGAHLSNIETGSPTGNLAWGEDGSTLFVTSNRTVYRLKLTTKGAGF
jgi:sugar lactone lactonase YvrE